MRRVAILGGTIGSLACAHSVLDSFPLSLVTVITADAEIGFPEKQTGGGVILNKVWGLMPEGWYGEIPKGVIQDARSATSKSWLCKAMAIRLSKRGAECYLRTNILSVDEVEGKVWFRGAGVVGSGVSMFDLVVDFRDSEKRGLPLEEELVLGVERGKISCIALAAL